MLQVIKSVPQKLPLNSSVFNFKLLRYEPIYKKLDISQYTLNMIIKSFQNVDNFYDVGKNGLPSNIEVGSRRISGFSHELSVLLDQQLPSILPSEILIDDYSPINTKVKKSFKYLGTATYFRYMEYSNKGSHAIHYDAPHFFPDGSQTLFSGVLYLNTPKGQGGETVFIYDQKNFNKPFSQWDTKDWNEDYCETDVLAAYKPLAGYVLLFPHQLPHGVSEYISEINDTRKIIRFDVCYTPN